MKLNRHRALTVESAPRWSGIDAGRRVQVGFQVTGVRHFRLSGSNVKPRSNARPMAKTSVPFRRLVDAALTALSPRPVLRGDRDYLRALRAAEMKAWEISGGDSLNVPAVS
jgi:hypothetical protein